MSRPITVNYDLATGETTEREMNDTEYKDYLDQCVKIDQAKAEAEVRATQKAALFARLGITAEEAQLLLS
jgi:hypothetical protein